MSIYVLIMISFNLLSWLVALMTGAAESPNQLIAILIIIAANILAVVFQGILL